MGKIRKFVWEWVSEYPIAVFVMFLVTVGHFIVEQINEHHNEELKNIISSEFFPNVVWIAMGCLMSVEAYQTYRKWKEYPRKAAVKPYFTKLEILSNSGVKAGFFAMDWVSIAIFLLSLYPIGFDMETDAYKKAMFFHGFFALAIVPFVASILFTIKKDSERR